MDATRTTPVILRALQTERDAHTFRTLNETWIVRYFQLEDDDHRTLGDPRGQIVAQGGQVLLAELDGQVVGSVALIPQENGVMRLAKMAVADEAQGRGIGRQLLEHAIEQARQLGARQVVLGSNTQLARAVHLYESIGFRHLPPERRPVSPYARANVFMELDLSGAPPQ